MDMGNDTGCDLSSMMHMRKMYFHFDACQRLLFDSWKITDAGELVGAIVAVYIFAILYEGLKTLREWLIYYDVKKLKQNVTAVNDEKNDKLHLVDDKFKRPSKTKTISVSFGMHILQSLLHVVQVGYGYILMFVAMTFNGWLFLAVCFGAGTGYFIFAKTRHLFGLNTREDNEHCH